MENKDDPQIDVSKGVKAAANEFAPNLVNDGGEGGAREVAPAPTPEASLAPPEEQAAPEDQLTDEERAAAAQKSHAREFVTYVVGELSDVAEQFGYERIVLKPKITAAVRGPVMMYHRVTEQGKVFNSPAEAGDDYISGDELRVRQNSARAAE